MKPFPKGQTEHPPGTTVFSFFLFHPFTNRFFFSIPYFWPSHQTKKAIPLKPTTVRKLPGQRRTWWSLAAWRTEEWPCSVCLCQVQKVEVWRFWRFDGVVFFVETTAFLEFGMVCMGCSRSRLLLKDVFLHLRKSTKRAKCETFAFACSKGRMML